MAKRRAKAGTRKGTRKAQAKSRRSSQKSAGERRRTKKATRKMSRPARKPGPARQAKSRPRPKARTARSTSRKTAPNRTAAPAAPKRKGRESGRPKPAALSRVRRQLREDETVPGAPSSLNFSAKASAAESGHQMYHQRAKEHTEGGAALTGGDVDTDWNEAYASGEETPGGDMSTPDQDVVEEIGRALGVEYEDAEELKGAEKIESRDRNRWEYDPASAEDYKDRNRRED